MAFLTDTFTEATGSPLLDAHTGETGATWTKHANSGAGTLTVPSTIDRLRVSASGGTILYYASGTPAGADYYVEAQFFIASAAATMGICIRVDPAANTYYYVQRQSSPAAWVLGKVVAGAGDPLTSNPAAVTVGQTYTVRLTAQGSAIKAYVDGAEILSVSDADITAAGRPGVRAVNSATNTTGYHLDSIAAADIAATMFERSAAIDGVGAVAASASPVRVRSAHLNATAAIDATGAVMHERSAAVAATGAVAATAQRIVERSAALTTAADIQATAVGVLTRSAALAASGGPDIGAAVITRVRAAALNATAAISATARRDLVRAAALNAVAGPVAGTAARIHVRSVSLEAVGSIASAATFRAPPERVPFAVHLETPKLGRYAL